MPKYIDREAVLLRLKKVVSTGDDFSLGMQMATSHAIECIEEAPAADVAEIKYGSWKLNKDGSGTCDQCKKTQKGVWDYDSWQNYCGCCGAKMDGKEKE